MKINFTILLLFLSIQCIGQNLDKRLDGLATEIDSLMEVYKTIGLSIAIVENNKIIYTNGFGYRNLNKKLPVTPNTLFEIGSITKQFTSSLIGIYQEQGKLSIYDKPSKHLKNLRFYSDEMNNIINIEDLLAHRSGIGGVDATHVFFPTNSINKHLERLPFLKPNSKVRERFDYSNMGYAILGAIGESITKRKWSENIKHDILTPMQMGQTNTSLKELTSSADFSYGYSIQSEKGVKVLYEDQNESMASGAMNSSASDMAKWAMMLLNKGKYKNKQIIPQDYLESSFSQNQILNQSFSFDKKDDETFNSYGYGWFVNNYKGIYRVNHSGGVSGFTSNIELYPHEKLGIVVLSNQTSSSISFNVTNIIANRMLGLERKKWNEYEIRNSQARIYGETINAINKDKTPNLPLSKFCGEYINKGYGTINISLENNNLIVTLPAFTVALEHHEYNAFYTVKSTELHQNTPPFYYNFQLNSNGNIVSLTIGYQTEPVEFTKMN